MARQPEMTRLRAIERCAAALVRLHYGAEPTALDPAGGRWLWVTCQTPADGPHGDGCPWPALIEAVQGRSTS